MKRILLALILLTSAAQAQTGLVSKNVAPSDPIASSQWSDVLAQMSQVPPGNAPPNVFMMERIDKFGRRITFTQLQSLFTCGASNCQSRLFVDGQLDREVAACQEAGAIQFSTDGTNVNACGSFIGVSPPNQ